MAAIPEQERNNEHTGSGVRCIGELKWSQIIFLTEAKCILCSSVLKCKTESHFFESADSNLFF